MIKKEIVKGHFSIQFDCGCYLTVKVYWEKDLTSGAKNTILNKEVQKFEPCEKHLSVVKNISEEKLIQAADLVREEYYMDYEQAMEEDILEGDSFDSYL